MTNLDKNDPSFFVMSTINASTGTPRLCKKTHAEVMVYRI